MRTIKFRAWDRFKNRMLFSDSDCFFFDESMTRIHLFNKEDYDVMQFIGHLDINKKEVYEGDICKIKDMYTDMITIVWRDNGFVGISKENFPISANGEFPNPGYSYYELEVIGNIYENKELL